jgi:hypothetical protein
MYGRWRWDDGGRKRKGVRREHRENEREAVRKAEQQATRFKIKPKKSSLENGPRLSSLFDV